MRNINPSEVIAVSKFNRFHLLIYLWCFYAIMFDGFDIAMFGVSLPWLMEEWKLTPVQAGAVGSYSLVGMMIGAFIFGPWADHIGKKKVLAICMILFSVFTLGAGLSPNTTVFTVMRFIAALGMGGLMPMVISLMTEYSPKRNRALIVATMYCGYSLGGILANLIGMYIVPETDWRIIYWIGIIPFLTLPFYFKFFPESLSFHVIRKNSPEVAALLKRVNPSGIYGSNDSYQFSNGQKALSGSTVKKLFENKRAFSTLAIWLAVFSCLLMVYGLNTWLPKIMQQSGYGLTSSLSFNLVLCCGQVLGSLLGGYMAEKVGHKRVLISLYLIGALCFVSLSLTSNLFLLYILILVGGACTVGNMNLTNPYITEYYPPEARATGMGWALGFGRIGAILAPTLIAYILAIGIAPQNAFLAFAIPSLIGAIALFLVKEKYGSFDKIATEQVNEVKSSINV